MQIFTNANYDFIRWRWHALAASALVVVAGVVFMIARGGMPLGIDFTGGTIVVAKFEQPVEADRVRQALETAVPGEKVIQSYGDAADRAALASPLLSATTRVLPPESISSSGPSATNFPWFRTTT